MTDYENQPVFALSPYREQVDFPACPFRGGANKMKNWFKK